MQDDITYLVGRLHIIANYTNYNEKSEYIRLSLESKATVSKRESDWGFFDVKKLVFETENYFLGYLVKYRPRDLGETVDKNSHTITNTTINDHVQAKSHFILHIKSGLICYRPMLGLISDNQFRQLFKEIFEAANANMLVNVEISPVGDPTEIISAIKDFDIIRSIEFNLHPSNPRFNDKWKEIDQKMRMLQADYYKGSFHGENGLKAEQNGEIMSEILMAIDGYGKAKIHGLKGNQKHSASTEHEPLNIVSNQDAPINELMKSVVDCFKEIWNRMTKDENQ